MKSEIIKHGDYSFDEYKKNIMEIYRDERTEDDYYVVIQLFLESIYSDDVKVIKVPKNRCSKKHDRNKYADKGGLADIIIVPNTYTYEKPEKQYANVEVKMPDLDIEDGKIVRYNKLKPKNSENKVQLNKQFENTPYIIFTDNITWYLLTKDENGFKEPIKELCLIERFDKEWMWKVDKHEFSDNDKEFFYNEMGFDIISAQEIEPKVWRDLKKELEIFLKKAKANYKSY